MRRQYPYLAVLVTCAILTVVVFSPALPFDLNLLCISNVQASSRAISEYTQDYDERFPPGMSLSALVNTIEPYLPSRSPKELYCPATHLPYLFNASLGGQSLSSISNICGAQLLRDSKPHRDGKLTVGYWEGYVERGGIDVEDPNYECATNVQRQAVAVSMYAQDYDERLPPMQTAQQFTNGIFYYVSRCQRTFVCPATKLTYLPNGALSGNLITIYPFPSNIVVLADQAAHTDGKKTYGFLDGHVIRR